MRERAEPLKVPAMRSIVGMAAQGGAVFLHKTKRAAPRDRPSVFSIVSVIYAAIFTFSTATATRFEIGWATSPASFSIASVFFDVCATTESNAERI